MPALKIKQPNTFRFRSWSFLLWFPHCYPKRLWHHKVAQSHGPQQHIQVLKVHILLCLGKAIVSELVLATCSHTWTILLLSVEKNSSSAAFSLVRWMLWVSPQAATSSGKEKSNPDQGFWSQSCCCVYLCEPSLAPPLALLPFTLETTFKTASASFATKDQCTETITRN